MYECIPMTLHARNQPSQVIVNLFGTSLWHRTCDICTVPSGVGVVCFHILSKRDALERAMVKNPSSVGISFCAFIVFHP